MKGDRRQGGTPADAAADPSSPPSPKFIAFRRRTVPLDWRRIASLDVEKVVGDGDPSPLEELTASVLFCKAEDEFVQTDGGFIKVFRLAQLIGEWLQTLLRESETRLSSTQKTISRLENEVKKFAGETSHLRDHLTLAKKELRRRKELLEANGGMELPHSPLDEYQQCPYCVKRFLISIYLYAHIQRRHQGLPIVPIVPVFPVPSGKSSSSVPPGAPILFQGSSGGSSILNHGFPVFPQVSRLSPATPAERSFHRRDSSTQTPGEGPSPVYNLPGPMEPNSGRSEGEVRQEGGDEIPGSDFQELPRTDFQELPRTHGDAELKSSSETMTVIKGPPSSWNLRNRSGLEEEGEVPPDEEESAGEIRRPFVSSSKNVSSVSPGSSRLDIHKICELIETFLEEKSVPSRNEHYQKILRTIEGSKLKHAAGGDEENVSRKSSEEDILFVKSDKPVRRLSRTEEVEEVVMRMKDEFESQWRDLSERVKDAGIQSVQNLQGTLLLSEIKKVQDILNSPCRTVSSGGNNQEATQKESSRNDNQSGDTGELSSPAASAVVPVENPLELVKEVVEERFQKQTTDLEELKSTLEMKMESELEKMKARLEEQNVLWRQQLLVQQSAGVTNLQESSPGKKGEAEEIALEIPSAGFPKISSSPCKLNMTGSPKAADSVNELSHQIPLPGEDVIIVPVPKPRKPPSLTSTVISRVEIPGSGYPGERKESAGCEMSYVRRSDRREEAGETGEREKATLSGKTNQVEEMQNEIVEQPRRTGGMRVLETNGKDTRVSKSPGGIRREAFKDETDEETGEEELSRNSESVTSSQFTLMSDEEEKEKARRVSYVFDDEKGRLVGDWEVSPKKNLPVPKGLEGPGDSQLELVRKKTLEEVGEELERVGINPEAEAISLEEMARALRHLKTSRPSPEAGDRETFKQFRSEVRGTLNAEVTRKSIQQKLEQSGGGAAAAFGGSGTSPLAKMLHKVKKSGVSWKKKVASAMRRKQKSPKFGELAESEVKTSFFSKSHWVKKGMKDETPRKSQDAEKKASSSSSGEEDSEEEESSVDIELPPFLTKSKPLLEKATDEELVTPNRRKESRKPEESGRKSSASGKSKLKDDSFVPASVFAAASSDNNRSIIPSSSSAGDSMNTVGKVPNFFVKESGTNGGGNSSATRTFPRVTSNGWSSNASNATGGEASRKFFNKSAEELIGADSKAPRRSVVDLVEVKKDGDGKEGKRLQERSSVSPANERRAIGVNKSWRDNLLSQLSSSSSSSEFSDSEDSSSKTTSVSSGKKKDFTGTTFSRSENNRVAFRKRHTSTSLSDEEEELSSEVKRRVGGFREAEVKGTRKGIDRNKVGKKAEDENSSDTSIWEDVEDDGDVDEEDDVGESESRDLPPPPPKNVKSGKAKDHHVKSNDAGERNKIPFEAVAKSRRKSSPPTNSWDSS